jgi:ABC-type transport system substrate-binding protein
MQLYSRIKKYLFLLACIFSVATAAHIVTLYIYEGAETVPEKGGTLTIGMIGSAPSLNPTQYRLDTGNDFVLRYIYRGLIKYNNETGSMEGDLANCDLSKSYGEVRCFFKQGSVWSTGEKITDEDVLATYSLLAETDINKKLQASLSKLAITRENGAIVFRSSTPSSELIQLLSAPIIKKSVTEKFRDGTITPEDAVYSGPYSFEKRDTDTLRQAERISLVRNDIPWENAGYSKFLIRFFL